MKRKVGGISQQMLTRTLRTLERDGMVARKAHHTVPPSVEYKLTELGRSLAVPVVALADWPSRTCRRFTRTARRMMGWCARRLS